MIDALWGCTGMQKTPSDPITTKPQDGVTWEEVCKVSIDAARASFQQTKPRCEKIEDLWQYAYGGTRPVAPNQ
jgi:hypothetical protein